LRNTLRLSHVSVVTKQVSLGLVRCFGLAMRLQGLKPQFLSMTPLRRA
jgi:hypothetical protein